MENKSTSLDANHCLQEIKTKTPDYRIPQRHATTLYLLCTLSLVASVTLAGMFSKKFFPCETEMYGGVQMLASTVAFGSMLDFYLQNKSE